MTPIDLGPATRLMADLVSGVDDDQLDGPTPCPDYTLGDLLDHVGGLAVAFTMAATKAEIPGGSQGPSADASRLGEGWRERITEDLERLAEAWRDPGAWAGMTQAGGIDLPGEVAGLVALDEVVIHGWDVARASGRAFAPDEQLLQTLHGFLEQFSGPGKEAERGALFGPEVQVPAGAPLLDRVVGMAGRDPAWSPRSVG